MGRVLQALKDNNFGSNTVIALTADHAWQMGEHYQYGKHSNFEEAVRVPWILLNPSIAGQNLETFAYTDPTTQRTSTTLKPDILVKTPVQSLDIYPTIVDAAGLPSVSTCPLKSNNVRVCTEGVSRIGVNPDDPEGFAISQYPRPARTPKHNSRVPKKDAIRLTLNKYLEGRQGTNLASFTGTWVTPSGPLL